MKPQQVWAIRFWLDREGRVRDRALFDLAIDSKPRDCDVVKVKIGDLTSGGRIRTRAIVVQSKTKRPVQFNLLEPARLSLWFGWNYEAGRSMILRSRAGSIEPITSAPGNTPASRRVGDGDWPSEGGLRNALASQDEGVDHLQGDW